MRRRDLIEGIQIARRTRNWEALGQYGRELLGDCPRDIYARQILGESLEKRGRVEEAIVLYEEALRIDSQRSLDTVGQHGFLERLDILYNRNSRYEECFRVCSYYVSRHPQSWDAWNRLRRAASRTGRTQLRDCARRNAEAIKQKKEEAKRDRSARSRRWAALYEEKLRKTAYEPRDSSAEVDPPPDLTAPDEEWGKWAEETTDLQRIEAQVQAGLSATAELSRVEALEKLADKNEMSSSERRAIVERRLKRLRTGQIDTILFSDRDVPGNYVQLTEKICEVSSRGWPGSQLPPLDEAQAEALTAMGFVRRVSSDQACNYSMVHSGLSIEQLADIVDASFGILGSSPDFVLVSE